MKDSMGDEASMMNLIVSWDIEARLKKMQKDMELTPLQKAQQRLDEACRRAGIE